MVFLARPFTISSAVVHVLLLVALLGFSRRALAATKREFTDKATMDGVCIVLRDMSTENRQPHKNIFLSERAC